MTSVVAFLSLALASLGPGAVCNQSGGGHKSQAEITRMTVDQRVQEYSREYIRHNVWHTDYLGLLTDCIARDGLNSIPAIVKILDSFDPTHLERKENDRYEASSAAVLLLADLDLSSFRLRGFEVGRAGIDALKRLTDRMRSANFEGTPSEDERSKKTRYEITVRILDDLRGTNDYDRAIQVTLNLRHKIKLSEKELLDFSNHLISKAPRYVSWSETDWYVDKKRESEGESPWQYRIIKNLEPFNKAYVEFKAKNK